MTTPYCTMKCCNCSIVPTATEQALRKLEDQLTCVICLNSYTEPKLLQCFHVFCKQCLEQVVVHDCQGQSLHCPSCCRSTLLPPTSVSGLQTAFYLNNLFEVHDAIEKVKEPQKTQCESFSMVKNFTLLMCHLTVAQWSGVCLYLSKHKWLQPCSSVRYLTRCRWPHWAT